MKGRVLLVFGLVAVILAGCSHRAGKVIPKAKMADIYYDMFVADQWLGDHGRARRTADTTLFYEPIFRAHGYTFKDFDRSVSHYLRDPERFSKILSQVADRLDKESKRLAGIQGEIENFRGIGGYVRKEFPTDTLSWPDSLVLWPSVDTLVPVCDTSVFLADTSAVSADSLGMEKDTIKTEIIDNELL